MVMLIIITLGAVVIINKKSSDTVLLEKSRGTEDTNKVLPEEEAAPIKSEQFKDGYAKAKEAVKQENNPQLKAVLLASNQNFKNKIFFIYVTDKEIINVDYNSETKEALLVNKRSKQAASSKDKNQPILPFFALNDYPVVPEEAVYFGLKEAWAAMAVSEDYNQYKQKYPDLFNYYNATLKLNEAKEWEWTFSFYENDPESQDKVIRSLDLKLDTIDKKPVILNKINLD